MHQNIVVYPTKGFLNTDYQIRTEKAVDFSIHFNGKKIYQGNLSKGGIHTLPRLKNPGEYTILCKIEDEEVRHTIQVEDALRLGSSELKKAYVFDEFQHIVFVMKDRTHFFDPTLSACVYTENFLSPQYIYCVNSQQLLFDTEHSEGTSISLFDADIFSVVATIECDSIVAHTPDFNLLFIKKSDRIIRLDTRNHLTEICHYDIENSEKELCWVDEKLKILYIVTKQLIHCVDLNSGEEKKHELQDAIGITKNGYVIYCTGRNTYNYKCVLPNCEREGKFTYRNLFDSVEFDGHPLDNEKWKKRNDYGFETYFEAVKDKLKEELKQETNEKIKISTKALQAFDCRARLSFHPTITGLYIVENVQWKYYTSIRYLLYNDSIEYTSQTQYETNILWIGKDSLQVKYHNHSYSSSLAVIINGNKASMAINETTSALLEDGIIKSTYDGAMTASKEITESTKIDEDEIIIDGEKISYTYIQCKNVHKLLLIRGNQYLLYELNDNNIWELRNSIQLNEQRYERAALSPDGKYVLYSKGGNQYALYNIETQEEETIKTGNFVDFDKKGNYIVADEKRQLRIYDPKTFECIKDCPEFYTFVSPDGKLYAKTGVKVRRFNLVEDREISKEEYEKLEKKYDMPKWADEMDVKEKEKYVNIRREYIRSHSLSFSKIKDIEKYISDRYFSRRFLVFRQYVTIGITKTGNEIDIPLDICLGYLNYISFSYDNKFVAIVGKPSNNGYLKLIKINFDEHSNNLEVEKEICDMEIANWATWTCAFNRNGMLATYDSNPNLYLIGSDDYLKFNDDNSHDYNFVKANFCIPDRSFMCFSNTGKYMALSRQGYRAISLGGAGHIPSNKMYIYSADGKFQKLDEWDYQGERIKIHSDPYKKNLVQAGFSANDDKIMTVSGDGVIVIRNLHLEDSVSDR